MISTKKNLTFSNFIIYVVLIVLAIVFTIPFYFIIINSFKTYSEITINSASFPTKLNYSNYSRAISQTNFGLVLINTITITLFSVLGMVIFGSIAAWKLVRNNSVFSTIMFTIYVASMVIPFQSVMIPLVKVSSNVGLLDHKLGLIFIYWGFGQAFSVFLFHGFIKGVPLELEECARLDGCKDFQLFIKIVFPLLKTITITVIILQTLWVWNDFLLPSLIIYEKTSQTIPLAINRFFGQYKNQWDYALPILVLGLLPIVIFFLALQKYMIAGISEGAIKG
ncbi:MAG: carbohydrate ABC transporter permease [Sphaerochaetaceae bacterium]|nr:carbohydrate ABC transporter permease [Sphaerochaetaceae bacterium]